jgi:hypothetical protein
VSPLPPMDLAGSYPGQRLIEVTVKDSDLVFCTLMNEKVALVVHAEIDGRSRGRRPFGNRFPGPDSVIVEFLYPPKLLERTDLKVVTPETLKIIYN